MRKWFNFERIRDLLRKVDASVNAALNWPRRVVSFVFFGGLFATIGLAYYDYQTIDIYTEMYYTYPSSPGQTPVDDWYYDFEVEHYACYDAGSYATWSQHNGEDFTRYLKERLFFPIIEASSVVYIHSYAKLIPEDKLERMWDDNFKGLGWVNSYPRVHSPKESETVDGVFREAGLLLTFFQDYSLSDQMPGESWASRVWRHDPLNYKLVVARDTGNGVLHAHEIDGGYGVDTPREVNCKLNAVVSHDTQRHWLKDKIYLYMRWWVEGEFDNWEGEDSCKGQTHNPFHTYSVTEIDQCGRIVPDADDPGTPSKSELAINYGT